MKTTRRELLGSLATAGVCSLLPAGGEARASGPAGAAAFPFRLAVINDEITADFEHACQVAANDFGLHWIELRAMWNKNVTELSDREVSDAVRILAAHKLRVTDIASPLFKTDWPGAPRSRQSEKRDQFSADYDAGAQDKLLERCISLAGAFGTNRIRCFDYWRLDDPKPFRAAINTRLREAAARCARNNIVLLLENEMSCNTATGAEAAAVLAEVGNENFMLNWDPGNAATLETRPYPDGYALLPKHRIGHCHCKDVVRKPGGGYEWAPVGGGVVDWAGQLQALKRDGYGYGLSLETHWRGAGTPEASTRVSMDGLKQVLRQAGMAYS